MAPLVICVGWRWEGPLKSWARIVGQAHGLGLLWTGRFVKAQEALDLGIVLSLRSLEELPSAVDSLCRRPDRRECWCSTW